MKFTRIIIYSYYPLKKTLLYPCNFIVLPLCNFIVYVLFYMLILAHYNNLCKRDLVLKNSVNCILKYPRVTT